MNKIVVSGNLAKDIEVRIVNVGDNNFPVASVTVANEVGYGDKKKVTFFNCNFTGEKRIEALEKYLVKGAKVIVSGTMIIENWKDEQGDYHTRPYIKVDEVEIVKFANKKADEIDYSKMKNDELKKIANEKGINIKGKKRNEVIEMLKNYIGEPVDDGDMPF